MRFEDLKQDYVKIKALRHAMPWKSWRYRSTNWRNILPLSTNLQAQKAIFSDTLLCLHQATQRNIPENCDLTRLFEIYVYME